ncbi:MAG: hypothetical protein JG764_1362 [Clostridiales bacterium]|jgi:hypothetical protein|nr:hypothetical protein [Clostridiales bacterium]
MFFIKDKYVFGMAFLRIISGIIEFSAAMVMLKLNRVEHALKINAVLAAVGPIVLMSVMALGLVGLAGRVSPGKILIIIIGVLIIFYGVQK